MNAINILFCIQTLWNAGYHDFPSLREHACAGASMATVDDKRFAQREAGLREALRCMYETE